MVQSRLELVVGTVERRATPPEVFVCAHVTSEYGAVGEGDHAEIVDSGKYSRRICNDGALVAACRAVQSEYQLANFLWAEPPGGPHLLSYFLSYSIISFLI
jgi:hypothetical protein